MTPRADWDPRDHLRGVPIDDIFELSASADASEIFEWVQLGIYVYIPHRKHQVKPTHLRGVQLLLVQSYFIEITFFCLFQQINVLNLK